MICKAPLVYTEYEIAMMCEICRKPYHSKTACVHGHYVCDACHSAGMDSLVGVCLDSTSRDPVVILHRLMALPFCHMHGPEHHVLVGASLLTAYRNAGGAVDLPNALVEMQVRGRRVPGGACGFWGACGAAISSGMFVSLVTGSTPLKNKEWALSNAMTSASLQAIAGVGGPRCCKRNAYLAIREAVAFAEKHLGVEMAHQTITCVHAHQNNQCIGSRCPFQQKGV